jgi:hypothetical protein
VVKRITLKISPDGSVSAEAHGRQGKKCVDDLAIITGLVGNSTILNSSLTEEFNLSTTSETFEAIQDWVQ